MRVLFINETCGTYSHGRICVELARELERQGHECRIAYGRSDVISEDSKDLAVRIGSKTDVLWHFALTRGLDLHGFGSRKATKEFLDWAEGYDPDMVWLHNLHGYYINVKLLFQWLKNRPKTKVRWTLHDCWAFTGHCAHYMAVGCEKWKNGCNHCPEKRQYPSSMLVDRSRKNYAVKKELFTNMHDLELITPSKWLADQTRESFLKEYPVSVVYNRINTDIFRPCQENGILQKVRDIHGIPDDKRIVLAVASKWTVRKGFADICELARKLKDSKIVLVVVGVNEKQREELPDKAVGILRTENREELAALYSMAEVFVNCTYEDTYPTVNLEAEACGCDVYTYDAGGSRETVKRDGSRVFPVGNLEEMAKAVIDRCEEKG